MTVGNLSPSVQHGIRIIAKPVLNLFFFTAALALIVGDIIVATRFFSEQLAGVSTNTLFSVLGINVSFKTFAGLCLALVGTGVKLAFWNMAKTGKVRAMLKGMNSYHRLSVIVALTILAMDILAVLGGLWLFMTGTSELPRDPSLSQTVVLIMGASGFLFYVPLLDVFAGMDRPNKRPRLRTVKDRAA